MRFTVNHCHIQRTFHNSPNQFYSQLQNAQINNMSHDDLTIFLITNMSISSALAHQYCATGLLNMPASARSPSRLASLYDADTHLDNGKMTNESLTRTTKSLKEMP